MNENDRHRPATLTASEVAELEAGQDGDLPPEARRARRYGSGELARRAEALAQSQLFDNLAKAAVHRGALFRQANAQLPNPLAELPMLSRWSGDLVSYRSEGLFWQAQTLAKQDVPPNAMASDEAMPASSLAGSA